MRTSTFCLNIGVLTLTLLASFCDVSAVVEQPLDNIDQNPVWIEKKNREKNRKQYEEMEKIVKDAVKRFDAVYPTEINSRPDIIMVTEHPDIIRQSTFSPSAIDPTKTPSEISKPINPIFSKEEPKYCYGCGCGVQNAAVESRIVNGIPTNHSKWPWVVRIILGRQHHCGGSLITKKHVLTAAHCVNTTRELPYMNLVFANNDVRRIEFVSMHRDYKNIYSGNDIAIIHLNSPVILGEDLKTICLPHSARFDYNGFYATVTGWGRTHFEGTSSNVLREVSIPVLSSSSCRKLSNYYKYRITDDMLCAGEIKTPESACRGDSGGPLQVRKADGAWEIIGIVSWGPGCRPPSAYTKVQNHLEWISQRIGNKCICAS